MKVNHEVMEKVAEVLKDQTIAEKMNKASSQDELYTIVSEKLQGVSQVDFIQALKDLEEAGGSIELTDSDLDSVAGGTAPKEGSYTVGTYQTNKLL